MAFSHITKCLWKNKKPYDELGADRARTANSQWAMKIRVTQAEPDSTKCQAFWSRCGLMQPKYLAARWDAPSPASSGQSQLSARWQPLIRAYRECRWKPVWEPSSLPVTLYYCLCHAAWHLPINEFVKHDQNITHDPLGTPQYLCRYFPSLICHQTYSKNWDTTHFH